MGSPDIIQNLKLSLQQAEEVLTELDRRIFHLKTLYDISKDIFATVDSQTILKNFLLMTMGNFGVMEGFIQVADKSAGESLYFLPYGLKDQEAESLEKKGKRLLKVEGNKWKLADNETGLDSKRYLSGAMDCLRPFLLEENEIGLLAMGSKLIGEPFDANDAELLDTLVNNLIVALKHAKSFEKISRLNLDLQTKNIELERTLDELTTAVHKVEILEDVKTNLSKFVPTTVTRLIEKSPNGEIPKSKRQDVSILFLDIENYTRICERLNEQEINDVVEKHFSVFMDAIYENNGDVNETAGDGLMVIFQNDDAQVHAMEAVLTAVTIREKTISIKDQCAYLYRPLEINMGINSGSALVGPARFESVTGSRWTYTARGKVTNVAARIGGQATGGQVFMSKETAARVKPDFKPTSVGKFKLKNVTGEVEIFKV